jgi:leader peptidase (prepilin peptidase) / N-methyltransferase
VTAEGPGKRRDSTPGFRVIQTSLIGVAGLAAVSASFAVAPGWRGLAGAALATLTLAIAIVDSRRLVIPNELNALAFMAGVAAVGLRAEAPWGEAIAHALLRAAVMFGAFFAFRAGYRRLRGIEGMGLGDAKLAAVAGVWLDWAELPIVVNIAALSALASVLLGRRTGKEYSRSSKLPFGAFFAPAIWICWLLAAWRGA